METKIKQTSVEQVKVKMDFSNGFVVNLMGKKGGVSFLWRKDDEIHIVNFSNSYIHAKVYDQEA